MTIAVKSLSQFYCTTAATSYDSAAPAAGKSWVVSTLMLTNNSPNQMQVTAWHRINGAAASLAALFLSAAPLGFSIDPGDSVPLTMGITMAAGDILTFQPSVGGLSIQLWGQENS